jgi:hypothetical protein
MAMRAGRLSTSLPARSLSYQPTAPHAETGSRHSRADSGVDLEVIGDDDIGANTLSFLFHEP